MFHSTSTKLQLNTIYEWAIKVSYIEKTNCISTANFVVYNLTATAVLEKYKNWYGTQVG